MILAILVATALLVAGCGDGDEPAKQRPQLRDVALVERQFAGIAQDDRVLGDPGAPYTLVEFADPQCPYCAAFAHDVLPAIIERYVRPGLLRIELRLIAFLGPDSGTAASAATAAAMQDRLWQFTDLLYRNQGAENSGWVTPAFLDAIARATPGLDRERLAAESASAALRDHLDEDMRAARTAGVTGTPALRFGRTGDVLTDPTPGPVTREAFMARLAQLIG